MKCSGVIASFLSIMSFTGMDGSVIMNLYKSVVVENTEIIIVKNTLFGVHAQVPFFI